MTDEIQDQYVYAIACHEAGHAVVQACVGMEVTEVRMVQIGAGRPGGSASAGTGEEEIYEISDYLASLLAGEIAVEEVCGGYRLPLDHSPRSDEAEIKRVTSATEYDLVRARRTARALIQTHRQQIIALAEALLRVPPVEGVRRIAGTELDGLLAPVRA
jgi:ATP-dependent Zn protease